MGVGTRRVETALLVLWDFPYMATKYSRSHTRVEGYHIRVATATCICGLDMHALL